VTQDEDVATPAEEDSRLPNEDPDIPSEIEDRLSPRRLLGLNSSGRKLETSPTLALAELVRRRGLHRWRGARRRPLSTTAARLRKQPAADVCGSLCLAHQDAARRRRAAGSYPRKRNAREVAEACVCRLASPDLYELATEVDFCPLCGGIESLRLLAAGESPPFPQASGHFAQPRLPSLGREGARV
jgi:hypothetical protein